MMRAASTLVLIALVVLPLGARAERGVIRGRVTYRGAVPPRAPLTVDVNTEVCGSHGPVLGEDLVVSAEAGLANTVVFLVGMRPRRAPAERGHLDQRNCVFLPHVQSRTAGSELVIGNDDPVVHNVHGRVDGTTVFNLGMPLRGVFVKRRLQVTGVTALSCDSGHHWMSAYVVVVPHPFHATSDAEGAFAIRGVPPGTYTLRAWHERLGTVDVPVTVEAEGDATVAIELPVRDGPRTGTSAIDFEHPTEVEVAARGAELPDELPPAAGPDAATDAKPEDAPEVAAPALAELARAGRQAQRDADVAVGRASYQRHCAACHGDTGDGRGEAALSLRTPPRVLSRGEFEFRSTRSGELAREEDLVRTITVGLPGTEMPAWGGTLPPSERRALARYVMSLSPRFLAAEPAAPVAIPVEGVADAASRERGKLLWGRFRCAQCHGEDGRSDGVSRRLVDDWGAPIAAADLSRGVYKSGPESRDLYRTLVTGLSGTPMPAFADLIGPTETWDLVHYVQSLAEPRGFFDGLFE